MKVSRSGHLDAFLRTPRGKGDHTALVARRGQGWVRNEYVTALRKISFTSGVGAASR